MRLQSHAEFWLLILQVAAAAAAAAALGVHCTTADEGGHIPGAPGASMNGAGALQPT